MQVGFSNALTLDSIKKNLLQYIYGSITLAVVAGVIFGLLTFVFLKLVAKKQVAAGSAA
jgi:hypothetical protein